MIKDINDINEPPTKVSGLQGERSWNSLFISPILEVTV